MANGHPQRRWANGRDAGLWHFCITPTPDFLPHYSARTRHRFKWKFPRACRVLLAKVLVTCLEWDTFFKRPFPVTTHSASFCPPPLLLPPHHSLFPCGGLSLSPSPSHCTFLTLPLQLHTYSSWFSLPHTHTLLLSHPKHTHYCSIPAKGFFFLIAMWVNKSKYEKAESDTHSFRGKHHLSNSACSETYECGQFICQNFFFVK